MRRIDVGNRAVARPPEQLGRVKDVARLGPYLSPRTTLNLAAYGARPDTIEMMNAAARKMAEDNDPARESESFWKRLGRFVTSPFNPNSYRSKYDPKNPLYRGPEGTKQNTYVDPATGKDIPLPSNPAYEVLKGTSRTAIALSESGWSGVNNFVFELNEDGTAPTGYQVLQRMGRLAEVVGTLGAGYNWNKQELDRAFKYTEAGTLFRNQERQGSGFMLPVELQAEQMLNVVGLDAQTGQPLPDYRGRARFGEFEATLPLPMAEGVFPTIQQPATLGGYAANRGWTAKRLPDGSIVEGKGLNLDSGLGSFVSGAFDAIGELATDPVNLAAFAGKSLKVGALSTVAYSRLSPTARAALPGANIFERFIKAGMTIDDIPLTTKSWTEIETLRNTFASEVDVLDDAVTRGVITKADRDAQVLFKESVLKDSEVKVWDADRLSEMIRTDSRFEFIFDLIDQARGKYADPKEAAYIIRNKIFKNRISPEDARKLAAATGPDQYREVFLEAADGLRRGEMPFAGSRISQLTTSQVGVGQIAPQVATRVRQVKESVGQAFERMILSPPVAGLAGTKGGKAIRDVAVGIKTSPLAEGVHQMYARLRNLFELAPDAGIMVDGSTGQRMAAIDSFDAWLRNLTNDEAYRVQVMGRVQEHLSDNLADIERYDDAGNIVTQRIVAPQSRAGVRAVEEELFGVIAKLLADGGYGREGIEDFIGVLRKERDRIRNFNIDEAANPTDYGALQRLSDYGLVDLDDVARELTLKYGQSVNADDLKIIGAATIQQLYNHTLVLPDWKQVRQMASNPFLQRALRKSTGLETGEKRALVLLANSLNQGWRQTTLMNIGYLARNLLDGQVALWMGDAGIYGMLHKPFRFLQIVRNKAGVEDILNNPMTKDGIRAASQKLLDELTPSEKQLLGIGRIESWGTYKEKTYAMERMLRTNDVVPVGQNNKTQYPEAVGQALRSIYADPLERILAQTAGITDFNARKDILLEWLLNTEEGGFLQAQLLSAYRTHGVRIGLPESLVRGLGKLQKLDLETKSDRLAFWDSMFDTIIPGRLQTMDEVPELQIVMAHNYLPKVGASGRATVTSVNVPAGTKFADSVYRIPGNQIPKMDNITGGIYKNAAGDEYFFIRSVTPTASGHQVDMIPIVVREVEPGKFAPATAWTGRQGTLDPATLRLINGLWEREDILPNMPTKLLLSTEIEDAGRFGQWWRETVDKVFIGGFGGVEIAFEKLPAYRQFKWAEYAKHYDELSGEALRQAEKNVVLGAKRLGMTPDEYMGGSTLGRRARGQGPYQALRRAVADSDKARPGATLEQLDSYASSVASYEMRQYFYDAPKKFNVESVDGLEWFFSFFAAQRSIMQRFVRLMVQNPEKPYRIARAFNGATELNLPGDYENGMLYQDPVTKQWRFRHPLGFVARSVAKASGIDLDGVTPYLGAPLRGFSIGFTGLPNIAPLGAIGMGFALDTVANLTGENEGIDAFRKTFMPFELLNKDKGTLDRLTPAILSKSIQLFRSVAMNQKVALVDREIGDAARALSTTGNYDFADETDRKRFEKESQELAQFMVGMSFLSQFFGPAAATPEYTVNLKGMDYNATALSAERQRLLEEDYETGNMKFLQIFGENALLYIVGKTTATKNAKGFMMTEKYVNWVKQNEFDVNNYKSGVGYYFGPPNEDEFSFGARAYLFDNQLTRYRTPVELVDAAQYSIASIKYRAFRNTYPTYLNEREQKTLRAYRAQLTERYLWTGPDFNPNDFNNILLDINRIIDNKAFSDSPLVAPLKKYIAIRNSLLEANGRSTFRSKAMTGARSQLDQFAESLIREGNPEFQRLYDRVLSQETDLAGTDEEAQP